MVDVHLTVVRVPVAGRRLHALLMDHQNMFCDRNHSMYYLSPPYIAVTRQLYVWGICFVMEVYLPTESFFVDTIQLETI